MFLEQLGTGRPPVHNQTIGLQGGALGDFFHLSAAELSDVQDISGHIGDSSIHFTEGSIDHLNIQNIGTNSHAQIDTHIGTSNIHFTEVSIDHTNIQGIGVNTHIQIDSHISSTSNPHTVTASQLTDFSTEFDSNFSGKSTTDLSEGTNLYYTEVRVSANVDVAANSAHRTNIGLDQHTQYILVDGTRSFSGVISGVTPTAPSHLTTKGYVDGLVSGIVWQEPVIDKDLATPPVSPTLDDRYIVASVGTGAWTGQEDNIAQWNGSSWDFTTPTEGFASWVEDEDKVYIFVTAWQIFGSVIDHQNLIGAGTNTHAQIDTHIADMNNPHGVTTTQIGAIGGSITDNQVAVGASTANEIEGTSSLMWDGSSSVFTVLGHIKTPGTVSIGDNVPTGGGAFSTLIGPGAGQNSTGDRRVDIGLQAGLAGGLDDGIAIGCGASFSGQGIRGISIGFECAPGQGAGSIAIGALVARTSPQAANGIIISSTGVTENNTTPGHIVFASTLASLKYDGTLWTFLGGDVKIVSTLLTATTNFYIGSTGVTNQGSNSIALGRLSGSTDMASNSVAIGNEAGQTSLSGNSVAIGNCASETNASNETISIGHNSGQSGKGSGSISLGHNSGKLNQGSLGIIISSSGVDENQTSTGHITIISSLASMKYNSSTDVFTFSKGITTNGVLDVTDATNSTSSSTGSIHTAGGLGVTKDLFVGSMIGIGVVPTRPLSIEASSTPTARFTNTATSGPLGGAGILYIADDGAALGTGDRLGFSVFGGSIDALATHHNATAISSFTTENWGVSNGGAEIRFETTPNGSTTRQDRLIIGNDGAITINGNTTINANTSLLGGLQQLVTISAAAAHSVLKTTSLIELDTTLNNIVATLPAIVSGSADNGRRFTFFRQTSPLNQVNLTPQAPSTIRGESTDIILGLKSDSITLLAVAGNWFPIDRNTFAIAVLDQLTPGAVQLIPTVTPAIVTAFDTDLFETNGILNSDHTSNNITVIHNESLTQGGDGFKIGFRIECNYNNNQELFAQIYINGSPVNIEDVRTSSNAFNTVLEAEGVVRVASAPETIELRILGTANTNATFEQCTLIVERVGK